MPVPSKTDIEKREAKLRDFLKKLDDKGKPREKDMINVVRSAIRSAWMKSDMKLAYLYMNTIPDMDNSTKTKWLGRCEICGELFKLTDLELDHCKGHHSFTKVEDFQAYFENILMVGFDDVQLLCKKTCHPTKTLSERLKISFEEAGWHRVAIELQKTKKDKEWLKQRGINPASNADRRREQIIEELKNELSNST